MGPVTPRTAQVPDELPILAELEATLSQGRPCHVAAEVFKPCPIRAVDADGSMQGIARLGMAKGRAEGSLGEVLGGALNPGQGGPSIGAKGNARLDRGGLEKW